MNDLVKLEESVVFSLRELYRKFGYSQFKMSKFEPYDLYAQNKEFLVSAGVITFTDTDGTLMALKPDVTLSIVKNFKNDTTIQKVCYDENVYRIAGAGSSYREITQTGLECLGNVGNYEICEVICLAVKSLRSISENFVLDLSHLGIVSSILSEMKLNEGETQYALCCLGEKNIDALIAAFGVERSQKLCALLNITGNISNAISQLRTMVNKSSLDQLEALCSVLMSEKLSDHVQIDFSIVSDGNYYNDFVFRGYVEGIPAAILAGGQYDRLMEKMSKQAKGIGFAVYLDQLELLDHRAADYDIDTVLIYDENAALTELASLAGTLSPDGVFLTKIAPTGMKYRKLMQFKDGRLITLEENN